MDMPGKTLWFYAGEVKTNIFEKKKKKFRQWVTALGVTHACIVSVDLLVFLIAFSRKNNA